MFSRRSATQSNPQSSIPDFPDWLTSTFPTWRWDWSWQAYLYPYLQQFTVGAIDRLGISIPPRTGKSEFTTIRYGAWRLIDNPSLRMLIACYDQRLANKFSRRVRAIVEQAGVELSSERHAAEEWETTAGGGLQARGVGAGVTGSGFNLILLDDLVKSREEADSQAYRDRCWDWYTNDLYTRLEPGGAMALDMTRWHEDDIWGRIEASADGASWHRVVIPALAEAGDVLGRALGEALCPERYDRTALLRIRSVDERMFNALYQCRPSAPEGNTLKRFWWRYWYPADRKPPQPVTVTLDDGTVHTCEQRPLPAEFDSQAQSWDCAFKDSATADYVVGQQWGKLSPDFFLLDQVREQMGAPETEDAIMDLHERYPDTRLVLIEDKANGPAVIRAMQRRLSGVVPVNPEGGKESRANAVAPVMRAGNVYLPHPSIAPWVRALVEECAAFPSGAHDDQVDAMTQYLNDALDPNWAAMLEGAKTPEEIAEEEANERFREMVSEYTGEEEE